MNVIRIIIYDDFNNNCDHLSWFNNIYDDTNTVYDDSDNIYDDFSNIPNMNNFINLSMTTWNTHIVNIIWLNVFFRLHVHCLYLIYIQPEPTHILLLVVPQHAASHPNTTRHVF